jgi:hypothetical protein
MIHIPPKEKAQELFSTIMNAQDEWRNDIECAIRIVIILVNEIIESRKDDASFDDTLWQISDYSAKHPMYLSYWIKVKEELSNIEKSRQKSLNNIDTNISKKDDYKWLEYIISLAYKNKQPKKD